jgi:hypothetical protein
MTPDEARSLGKALGAIGRRQAALGEKERSWLRAIPVRRALETLDAYPDGAELTFVSPEMEGLDAELHRLGGDAWVSWYWKLVLIHLVARSLQGPRPFTLPPSVLDELLGELDRIVDEADSDVERPDPLGDDGFLLDIGLSRGVVIPFRTVVGVAPAWLPETADLPRGPWVETHFRPVSDHFGPEVLKACADPLIDFFLANDDYEGWFGYTWLGDPKVAEISPHLGWYREVLLAAGAEISPAGTDQQTVAAATATSSTRQGLVEEGRFRPRDYRIVLRRDPGLRWRETTAALLG